MVCRTVDLPGGGRAIVCGPRQRRQCSVAGCGAWSTAECDWPMGKGRTCDAHLCARHAVHLEPDVDYCAHHELNPA